MLPVNNPADAATTIPPAALAAGGPLSGTASAMEFSGLARFLSMVALARRQLEQLQGSTESTPNAAETMLLNIAVTNLTQAFNQLLPAALDMLPPLPDSQRGTLGERLARVLQQLGATAGRGGPVSASTLAGLGITLDPLAPASGVDLLNVAAPPLRAAFAADRDGTLALLSRTAGAFDALATAVVQAEAIRSLGETQAERQLEDAQQRAPSMTSRQPTRQVTGHQVSGQPAARRQTDRAAAPRNTATITEARDEAALAARMAAQRGQRTQERRAPTALAQVAQQELAAQAQQMRQAQAGQATAQDALRRELAAQLAVRTATEALQERAIADRADNTRITTAGQANLRAQTRALADRMEELRKAERKQMAQQALQERQLREAADAARQARAEMEEQARADAAEPAAAVPPVQPVQPAGEANTADTAQTQR